MISDVALDVDLDFIEKLILFIQIRGEFGISGNKKGFRYQFPTDVGMVDGLWVLEQNELILCLTLFNDEPGADRSFIRQWQRDENRLVTVEWDKRIPIEATKKAIGS